MANPTHNSQLIMSPYRYRRRACYIIDLRKKARNVYQTTLPAIDNYCHTYRHCIQRDFARPLGESRWDHIIRRRYRIIALSVLDGEFGLYGQTLNAQRDCTKRENFSAINIFQLENSSFSTICPCNCFFNTTTANTFVIFYRKIRCTI